MTGSRHPLAGILSPVLGSGTGDPDILIVVSTAGAFIDGVRPILQRRRLTMMPAAAVLMLLARCLEMAALARMHRFTVKYRCRHRDEAASAVLTCVHVKAYDTDTVTYKQQSCGNTYVHILHHNLQRYEKFFTIFALIIQPAKTKPYRYERFP